MANVISSDEAKKNLAINIDRLMRDREPRMTQQQLADEARCSVMTICYILRAKKQPTANVLANIAEALGVTVDSLLAAPNGRRKKSLKTA